ncbi:MAG: TauD/TfdA family dioxygenase [Solirubrobacterales bacterium]
MGVEEPVRYSDKQPRYSVERRRFADATQLSAEITNRLISDGYCVVTGNSTATEHDLTEMVTALGGPVHDLDAELAGPPVMDLRHDASRLADRQRPAYFTADDFALHTDMSYVEFPPRLLLTQCVNPASSGGVTVVSKCEEAWSSLNARHCRELAQPVFEFEYPPGCEPGESNGAPVFSPARTIWRFRRDLIRAPGTALEALDAFERALIGVANHVRLLSGDLLVADNWRVAHGRTSFVNEAGAPPRFLRRAYSAGPNLP